MVDFRLTGAPIVLDSFCCAEPFAAHFISQVVDDIVRDNVRESDGDCKFSSTHSQVDMMGKTGNIHSICTKGFIFVVEFSEQHRPNVSKIYTCCFSSIELVNSVLVT